MCRKYHSYSAFFSSFIGCDNSTAIVVEIPKLGRQTSRQAGRQTSHPQLEVGDCLLPFCSQSLVSRALFPCLYEDGL
ncbi:hypothetical protein N656DRAFT_184251 [Canariomyces notabilis]|uniref:Uncharacterized protein n=1 Tax=Canariomyces notabilis TaxID=2074819 RepID=A0AAN6QII6_9PEZI|nr:hypothetical protein N656DRAFT_184251 [Canariomyces arenarius]